MEKYTGKIMPSIMRMLIHSSFCVMACMWLLYRPNFAEVARTTYKADQT
jgi:hypothetical protein